MNKNIKILILDSSNATNLDLILILNSCILNIFINLFIPNKEMFIYMESKYFID